MSKLKTGRFHIPAGFPATLQSSSQVNNKEPDPSGLQIFAATS